MNCIAPPSSVVVIGTGVAGSICARNLALAGCAVHVVDKSRGVGGRLATRRLQWLDATSQSRTAHLDHGAPAFSVSDEAFRQFLVATTPPGALARWNPTLAVGGRALESTAPLWLPQPDMPSLCRHWLRDIPVSLSFAVDSLVRHPAGWQLQAAGATLPGHFDAVVLALPPAQAAPLLAPYRGDWAQRASLTMMQPCWTLMGVARQPATAPAWDVARPEKGPLAWIMRSDARPGRAPSPGEAHWVAHSRAGWSRQHLEQPAEWVQSQLQAALQDALGEPVDWQHAVVHRWRYATPPSSASAAHARPCWWDAARGLGACSDFLGGDGVEGAWRSAQTLTESILRRGAGAPRPNPAPSTDALFSSHLAH